PREPAHERLAVELLELVEAAPVDDPRDQLAWIGLLGEVLRYQPVELRRVGDGILRRGDVPGRLLAPVEIADDGPDDCQRMLVARRVVVGDARTAGGGVGGGALPPRPV